MPVSPNSFPSPAAALAPHFVSRCNRLARSDSVESAPDPVSAPVPVDAVGA